LNLPLALTIDSSAIPLGAGPGVTGNVGGVCFFFVIMPALKAIVCWLVIANFRQLPAKYRLLEPNMTWLLLVPIFALYWNFKVFPALAESYQAYFYSRGVAEVEDCGERLARLYCALAITWVIPCLNFFTFIAGLIVLILFLIKADDLKRRIAVAA